MKGCEAMTVRGERCVQDVSSTVAVAGVRRRLCGAHARHARRGHLRLWEERPPVEPGPPRHGRPWTDDDDELLADHGLPTSEVAARLGRTVTAVVLRRSLKRRGLV